MAGIIPPARPRPGVGCGVRFGGLGSPALGVCFGGAVKIVKNPQQLPSTERAGERRLAKERRN